MEDRYYQTEAQDAVLATYDAGIKKMLLVMATGTGKTIVFSRLYEKLKSRLPGKMLALAHTEELVKQNAEKMQSVNPTLKVGIEMGDTHADDNCDIVSSSVQTLGRKGSSRVEKFKDYTKFILDEAHHSTGDSYQRVLDATGAREKFLAGFTATAQRADGVALSGVFDSVAYCYDIRRAIKDKYLVDLRGYRVKTGVSLAGVSTTAGDFAKSELSLAVNTPERNDEIVKQWIAHGEGRKSITFCVDIQHAKDLAQAFRNHQITSCAVWGEDPDRDAKIAAHKAGEFDQLCNCSLLIEGYDDPSIACIVDAAPTLSPVRYAQKVGRVTRLWQGKVDGIVLDCSDNCVRHTVITLPSLMGITSPLDLEGKSLLTAVEEMEAAQENCPTLDLSKLDKIGDLKTIVSKVDMFEVRFPAEVETNSDLTWFRAIDGGYKMLVPKETHKAGQVRIWQNTLDQWELWGNINDEEFHGIRTSMEECFKVCDEQIRKRVSKQTLSYIKREATWHAKPVTKGQRSMLTRLFPKRVWPFDHMTSGQASKIISERLGRFQ